jgi:hypothetical protein
MNTYKAFCAWCQENGLTLTNGAHHVDVRHNGCKVHSVPVTHGKTTSYVYRQVVRDLVRRGIVPQSAKV